MVGKESSVRYFIFDNTPPSTNSMMKGYDKFFKAQRSDENRRFVDNLAASYAQTHGIEYVRKTQNP